MLLLNYAIIWTALSCVYLYNYFHTHGVVHVTIDKGILRGSNASTWSGTRYFSFKGIPYLRQTSDRSRSRFQARAILQSGSALNSWALSENGAVVTARLAEALGAKNIAGATARAFEFLKVAPYDEIVRVQGSLITAAEERIHMHSLFNPSVEKGVKSEEVFLPDSPLNILESGNYNQVPYIIGHTNQEGYFFMNELGRPGIMKAAIDDTERYVPRNIKNEEQRNDVARSIREFYFDDKPIARENISNLVKLYSDSIVISGMKRAVKLHLRSTQSPIFFYDFSYDGGMNLVKYIFKINRPGAVHGDELGYLVYNKLLFWRRPSVTSEDEYVLKTMIRLWTNLAKYGNPTPAGDSLTWKPVTIEKFNYLNISGRNMKLDENPHPERTDFWEKAYENTMHCNIDVCYQQTKR